MKPILCKGVKSALIFNHVSKCAGSSLVNALKAVFGASFWVLSGWDQAAVAESLPQMFVENDHVFIHGHGVWGIHESLPDGVEFQYFTFLRDPFLRAMSESRYLASNFQTSGASVNDLVKGVRNHMVRHLAWGDYEQAQRRLDEDYFFVGITERFNGSLHCLAAMLGVEISCCPKENVTSGAFGAELEPDKEFRGNNAFDYALYNSSLERFDELVKHIKPERIKEKRVQYSPTSLDAQVEMEQEDPVLAISWLEKRLIEVEGTTEHHEVLFSLARTLEQVDEEASRKAYKESCALHPVNALRLSHTIFPEEEYRFLTQGAMEKLPVSEGAVRDSEIRRCRQVLCSHIAASHMREGSISEACSWFAKGCEICAPDWPVVRGHASTLRMVSRLDEALEVLDTAPKWIREKEEYCVELAVTAYLRDGLAGVDAALDPLEPRSFEDSMIKRLDPDGAGHLLSSVQGLGNSLIFRCAPEVVCDDLLRQLHRVQSGRDVHLAIQDGCNLALKWPRAKTYSMGTGQFVGEYFLGAHEREIVSSKIDTVIIPTNGQLPLESYSEFFAVAEDLSIPRVMTYSLWNIFVPESEKRLLLQHGEVMNG